MGLPVDLDLIPPLRMTVYNANDLRGSTIYKKSIQIHTAGLMKLMLNDLKVLYPTDWVYKSDVSIEAS